MPEVEGRSLQQAGPTEGLSSPFSFEPVGPRGLRQADLLGRFSVLGLVTSYDSAALAQARFLQELAHRHSPRLNVGLLFLEPRENLPLMELFLRQLRFDGPAGLADAETLAGRGAFPGLHHVPAVLVLDPQGRERRRSLGLTEPGALEALIHEAERESGR